MEGSGEGAAKSRITVCILADGSFDILINEAGRDLLVEELQNLDERWDHFHLDYFAEPEMAFATEVQLAAIPYRAEDRILTNGTVTLRPDKWDREHYPHVVAANDAGEP